MDEKIVDATLKFHIGEMRERLDRAASIARATETCATAGNIEKAIKIALNVEQLIYEVNTLLNAVSMINRISEA